MLDWVFSVFSYVVPFLAVLLVIVFVHEMGHYLVARWNGVAIQTFSLGFGPEIAGFNDRRGTRWRLSAIPLGGYVRFVGDMNAASVPDNEAIEAASPELAPQLLANKSVWQRIAVVAAGPAANVLFTFVVLYALLLGYGRPIDPVILGEIFPGSVAERAGLATGDKVLTVDGYAVMSFDDLQRLVSTSPERPITVDIERNGVDKSITVTPEAVQSPDQFHNEHRIGRIGVGRATDLPNPTIYKPNPVEAVGMTFEEVHFIVDRTAAFIGDFFVGRGDVKELGGPVRVAKVSQEVASLGIAPLINLMALLSLNIGLFNLFPIPMLDGGHLLYYLIEAARGRPLSPRVQEIGFRFGLALVFTLAVFTLYNDLF